MCLCHSRHLFFKTKHPNQKNIQMFSMHSCIKLVKLTLQNFLQIIFILHKFIHSLPYIDSLHTPPPKTHMLRIHWRHECLRSPIDPARDLKLQSRAGWMCLVDAMIFNGFIHSLIQCGWVIPSWELTYPLKNQFLKIIFLFPRWDMFVPWRVLSTSWLFLGGQSKIERILYQIYIVGNLSCFQTQKNDVQHLFLVLVCSVWKLWENVETAPQIMDRRTMSLWGSSFLRGTPVASHYPWRIHGTIVYVPTCFHKHRPNVRKYTIVPWILCLTYNEVIYFGLPRDSMDDGRKRIEQSSCSWVCFLWGWVQDCFHRVAS